MSVERFPPIPADELLRSVAGPPRWLWAGYLAAGSVTVLTSRWKTGKTTLLSLLLKRLAGGGRLIGRDVAAGRAVVVSEEDASLWGERIARLGIGPHASFLCRPFRGRPAVADWLALLDELAVRPGLGLVVIDPLASFLPSDENNAATLMAALAPLQRLTTAGAAVLLLHHPRKLDGEPRGSGALSGFADVLVELHGPPPGAADDRRRTLKARSRFDATPRTLVAELTADGGDYAVIDGPAEEFATAWPVLQGVLEDARCKRTRREILANWPEDHAPPGGTTLWRWLDAAVARGWVVRDGSGRRRDPYRYWLHGREAHFANQLADLPDLADLPPLDKRAFLRVAAAVLSRTAGDEEE